MSYATISLPRLALAVCLLLVALVLSRLSRLDLERDLAWGAIRGAAQLVAVGAGLVLLFRHETPWLVGGALVAMAIVAAFTSARPHEHGPPRRALLPGAFVAIAAAALTALLPMVLWIIPTRPWYAARYVIPIGGIMLSSAMNVVALVFERLFASAAADESEIEAWLALGATPAQALQSQVRTTLRAALMPTINGLLTVGLVALPGMMTGQIIAGADPGEAVRYQIVILYQLVAVAAVAGTVSAFFARRLLFDARARLVLPGREDGAVPTAPVG